MRKRLKTVWTVLAAGAALVTCVAVHAQTPHPMSPRGTASAQVLGSWTTAGRSFTLGRGSYEGGKWIEVSYGRPLKRGRDLFGAGASYGKAALVMADIWRAGADQTTMLKTDIPLRIGGTTVPPGDYTLFVDLKENAWTFVVSRLVPQQQYDPNEKVLVWGAYNYTPAKDVLRAPMKLETLAHAREELTWEFVDMTAGGGALALSWDKTMAVVPFAFGS